MDQHISQPNEETTAGVNNSQDSSMIQSSGFDIRKKRCEGTLIYDILMDSLLRRFSCCNVFSCVFLFVAVDKSKYH